MMNRNSTHPKCLLFSVYSDLINGRGGGIGKILHLLTLLKVTFVMTIRNVSKILLATCILIWILCPVNCTIHNKMTHKLQTAQEDQGSDLIRVLTSRPTSESSSKELNLTSKLNQTWTKPDLT